VSPLPYIWASTMRLTIRLGHTRFAVLSGTLGITAAVLVLSLACARGEGGPVGPADLLLRGGAVYTVDAPRSWATAVGVKGGRIIYVGSDSVPGGMIGSGTELVDLGGRMVLPGFQDGHVHLIAGGVELGECTLFTLESPAAIADSIKACATARPNAPWVRGAGWELTVFPDANPSSAFLDRVVGDRPAIFDAADGHSAWANSKALALAGITRDTPDPPDGRIERDPRTRVPSGTLRERAIYLVSRLLPERSDAELSAGLERA
jgi:predicted amidohydrolase YtcJ